MPIHSSKAVLYHYEYNKLPVLVKYWISTYSQRRTKTAEIIFNLKNKGALEEINISPIKEKIWVYIIFTNV